MLKNFKMKKFTNIITFNVFIIFYSSFINVCDSSDFLEYCANKPNITIDSVIKLNESTIYVTSGNLYARVLSITWDHLPIIADGYPKLIDHNFKVLQTKYSNISALDYEFINNEYYLKAQHQKDRKFIGFNQVWIGCPQPLCIHGSIDAIMKDEGLDENSLNIKIFRGKYFWEIGNYSEPPLVENAKLISDNWDSGLKPPIDAVFTTWDLNPVFFKGNKSFTFRLNAIVNDINRTFKGLPNHVNAAMYWDRGSIDKEFLFIFKGYQVWALRNSQVIDGWPKNISSINNNLPINISAALIDYNDNVFIFKNSIYYKFKADFFESNHLSNVKLKPKLVFQDIFHCNNSLYTEWGFGSYNDFISKFYPKAQDLNFVDKSEHFLNLNETEKSGSKLNSFYWLIALIVIALIIILSIIGVLFLIYCILKIKKKSHERQKMESIAVMRPLMNDNVNHLEIISIEDFSPKKTKKSNTRTRRTNFSDEAYG